jgi:hypothetical protein
MLHAARARWAALVAGAAVALPAAAAQSSFASPLATAAGGDAPPLNPSVVGVPIARTDAALSGAADAIDAGDGAGAAAKLTASRRYLLRSYSGAKYLIANQPAPPAEDARVKPSPKKFVAMAKRAIRASHRRAAGQFTARAADDPVGPVFADAPTAVFNVLTSQYSAATAAVGMAPDASGNLLAKVKTTLNTAIILRNRLVQVIHAAAPPVADEARVKAHAAQDDVTTFDVVMPGLTTLIDDELQQMKAAAADPSVPAASQAILTNAVAADTQVEALVNQYWPPATEG